MIGMARHEYADMPMPTKNLVTKNNQNNYFWVIKNKKIIWIKWVWNVTLEGMNEPAKVISDQKQTPNVIIHFRLNLSPK